MRKLLPAIFFLLIISACDDTFIIEGDNGIVSTEIDIENFSDIVLNIDAEVVISNSDDPYPSVIIEAQKLITDNINLQVVDNSWVIKYNMIT